MIVLDYRDKRPLYEQVYEKLQNLIVRGALKENYRMPSVRSLAVELAINPNTIQRAYSLLETNGYIYTISGRGNFVSSKECWLHDELSKLDGDIQLMTIRAKELKIDKEQFLKTVSEFFDKENLVND